MTVRELATPTMRQVVRAGALTFGSATAEARLLPHFLVVGAQRSGTTTLYRLLVDHPCVVRPAFHKGIGYFDLNYARGMGWYRGHFPVGRVARWRTGACGTPMTFDSSGYYLYHPLAPQRIGRDLPGVKVVALLRDPVERAFSAHAHELARGYETESFERAIALEARRIAGEEARLRNDPEYRSYNHRHFSYRARGQYAEQLDRYRESLGSDRVLALDADDFFADPVAAFVELQQWLGLPVHIPDSVGVHNARPRQPMDPGLRRELTEHFEPWDERLSALLDRTPSWRR